MSGIERDTRSNWKEIQGGRERDDTERGGDDLRTRDILHLGRWSGAGRGVFDQKGSLRKGEGKGEKEIASSKLKREEGTDELSLNKVCEGFKSRHDQ